MDGKDEIRLGRRALLAAGVAGAAAAAAQAMVGPAAVAAADHDPLKIGETNTGSTETLLNVPGTNGLGVRSDGGDGLRGSSSVANKSGVYGWNDNGQGYGVTGRNTASGAYGYLGSGWRGVYGFIGGDAQIAMEGETSHAGGYAIAATNTGSNTRALLGTPTTGVDAYAPLNTNYFGLQTYGRLHFSHRSGQVTIAAGKSSVRTTVYALTSSSMVLATLQTNRSGVYVQAAVASPAADRITIYLNKKVTAATTVAYFVLD